MDDIEYYSMILAVRLSFIAFVAISALLPLLQGNLETALLNASVAIAAFVLGVTAECKS